MFNCNFNEKYLRSLNKKLTKIKMGEIILFII